MADEIKFYASLTMSKAGAGNVGCEDAASITFAGTAYWKGKQAVGIAEEALVLGDTTAAGGGVCRIKNLDATNYVEVRAATGATALIRINAGEAWYFRRSTSSTAPFVIANTAPVSIEVLMFDN